MMVGERFLARIGRVISVIFIKLEMNGGVLFG